MSRALAARLLFAALAAGAAVRCTSGPPPPSEGQPYEQRVLEARRHKDDEFKAAANPNSPIPKDRRASFAGLSYYPVSPEYRVPAALTETVSNPPVVIALPNSAHELEQKVKVGTLAFALGGTTYRLSAFGERVGRVERLWVPFRDLTSGIETYGGGRYLDLERTATGLYDLDFNRAYHPYCVYDTSWVCPYPPSENRLPVAIRAGERLPESTGPGGTGN
ncbi:MAG: DUF1684 domain-containing protein [Acidobacteria bacterium]|nr:DUF1684 domain-containing protein [Acidobacteriota bacterium]